MTNKFDVSKARESKTFKSWFNEKFIPSVSKLGNQRHLAAIRDSFGTMIPMIIAGSIGILINAIIFGGAGSGYVSLLGLIAKIANPEVTWGDLNAQVLWAKGGWSQTTQIAGYAFGIINYVTVGMMAIWFSFLFGYYLAISRGFQNPLVAGLVSGAAFMLASLGEIKFFMGAQGLISAILFGIIATELFIKLSKVRALNIKMPEGVPPAVGKSFAVFLPACITLGVIAVLNIVVLAPAIVTGDLKVNASTYQILDSDKFKGLFGKGLEIKTLIDANSEFKQHKDLLEKVASILNQGNSKDIQKRFVDFYNDLSGAQQSVVTTGIATWLRFEGSGSAIAEISKEAKTTFVDSPEGYLATFQWLKVVIKPEQFGMGAAIYKFFTSWFIGFATGKGGIGLAVIFIFLVSFFWFFGIHGSNLVAGIFEPIWLMILGINVALVTQMGYDQAVQNGSMGVFTKPFFDAYMYIGGSGATLGLLLMTLSFSKRKDLKEIAKYATPAGIFQINEPAIFGYPLILNPVYVTPFILVPIVNLFIGWVFSPAVLGFVKYSYVATPWTAPWFLAAVITSLDIKALLPAFIIFGVDLLLWLPFVLLDNKLYFKKLKMTNPEQYEQEVRYFTDREYKYLTDTQTKVDNKLTKAELVMSDAEESIAFWEKHISNPEKLAARKKAILDKANRKKLDYQEKAEKIKKVREAKFLILKPKWEQKK